MNAGADVTASTGFERGVVRAPQARAATAVEFEPWELDALVNLVVRGREVVPMSEPERWVAERVLDAQTRNKLGVGRRA